jgi:glucose/arabinose dehydrogenase
MNRACGAAIWALATGCGVIAGAAPSELIGGAPQLARIKLPPGFQVQTYADGVDNARSMTLGPNGTLFVGTREAGRVYAVVDRDLDHRAETVKVIATGLTAPNGVAFRRGSLYVAEQSRVLRFDDIMKQLDAPPKPIVVNASLPDRSEHGWKFIAFSPDDWLYVPIGAPCNVCESSDPRFATITRMRPDGSEFQIYARGIRNSVGFDWQPGTNVLWFTDNGRDYLGDDRPPDELNRAPQPGLHFGFPGCHGTNSADPEFHEPPCKSSATPAAELGPHVAALGMRFYTGSSFPAEWSHGVFIAEHGSWNRSQPVGYRVTFVPIDGEHAGKPHVFAEGWLKGGIAWGRPVDVEVLSDGSLLVSDDKADAIYRISYRSAH